MVGSWTEEERDGEAGGGHLRYHSRHLPVFHSTS